MGFDYHKSVIAKLRKGTPDDSFVYINETLQVVNSKVTLSEIPDTFNKVIVTDNSGNLLTEITSGTPEENQFLCDYNLGLVLFHPNKNNERFNFEYYGRGSVFLAADRIYTKQMHGNEIIQTLRDVLNEADSILNLSERFTNLGEYSPSTVYYDRNIVNYDNAAYMCIDNNADGIVNIPPTDTNHWRQLVSVKEAIDNVNLAITEANNATNNANNAADNANTKADLAQTKANEANSAAQNAQDIADNTKYIEPYNNTTTYVKNNIVSFNGASFIAKQTTVGNPPPDPEVSNENAYWGLISRKGMDGTGTVHLHTDKFTATEGQTVFTLNHTYDQFQNRTTVLVDGVPQRTPENYEETTSNSITLSEGVPAGTVVEIRYFSESVPLESDIQTTVDNHTTTISSHNTRLNNIDTELANVNTQLAQKAKKSDLKSKAPKNRTLQIIAHRGFAHLAPENTMTAFTLAVNAGAYGLECDVQISSDGVPVLIHDLTVDRTTNGTGNVKDMTLEQLQSLDAGSKAFGEIFSSARIPTFEEFLRFSRSRAKVIYPEIKNVRNVDDIKTIVDLIIDHEMVYKTVISSFTLEHLYEVRKYSSDLNFGYLADVNISETEYDILEEDGNCTLLINYTNVINDPGIVKECNNRNIDIVVWTPNNKNSISQLLDLGVYKIMSDRMFGGWKND